MNYVRLYWDEIQSGNIVVSKKIKKQYKKFIDLIDNPVEPWIFDEELGEEPIEFIEAFCKHSKGKWAGKAVILELWQKAKIQAVYGFIDKNTGLRKYNEVMCVVARKNGKSTEKSALGNYMLIADGESGAEVYTVATKKDQARIVFTEMVNMRNQNKTLQKIMHKRKSDMYVESTMSKVEPLASDSDSLDGLNAHYVICDEVHAWKDRNLYDVMIQSMSLREQPIIDTISTAGFVREGIYDNLYDYAEKVLDGIIENERFAAFIYELDERSEWTDHKCWQKANPSLGSIKPISYIEDMVERAKQDPNFLPTVLVKDFNVRETTAGSWLTFEQIDNKETYELEDIKDSYAIGGVDLSSTTDLTNASLLLQKEGKLYLLQMYFIPEDIMEKKVQEDKVPYDIWAKRGLITVTPGNSVDYSYITDWFVKMVKEYEIRPLWVGYDPWQSTYWVNEMESEGFQMEKVRQGAMTMSGPMKQMGADLGAKKINYNNNPITKWCLSNTNIKRDENDNIRPVKGRNQRLRIDGTVGMINCYVVYQKYLQDYLNMV